MTTKPEVDEKSNEPSKQISANGGDPDSLHKFSAQVSTQRCFLVFI